MKNFRIRGCFSSALMKLIPIRFTCSVAALVAASILLSSCAGEKSNVPIAIRNAFLTDKLVRTTIEGGSRRGFIPAQMDARENFDATSLRRIYAYIGIENFSGSARIEWVRPDGKVFQEKSFYIEGDSSLDYRTGRGLVSTLHTKYAGGFPGRWTTNIYINGELSETLRWNLQGQAPYDLSDTKPSSSKLIAASSAALVGGDGKLSGKIEVIEGGEGKRFYSHGYFDGLEEGKFHVIRKEFFRPNGKLHGTLTQVLPGSYDRKIWVPGHYLKLDKKYDRLQPSGLWTVKFFVNDHYIGTLSAVIHKEGEDPAPFIKLLQKK